MEFSKRRREGYLMVDHRASPGTPMYSGGIKHEMPTQKCPHCGTHVIINPNRVREREYCRQCDFYICDNCGLERKLPDYVHKTEWQKLMEAMELHKRIEGYRNG